MKVISTDIIVANFMYSGQFNICYSKWEYNSVVSVHKPEEVINLDWSAHVKGHQGLYRAVLCVTNLLIRASQ